MFSLMLNAKLFPLLLIKSECTLWNISFRLFHETQFNAYFITFNLISWNSYDICKKETSTNLHKQKMPYPYVCHVSLLWELVDLFSMKRLFSQETVFFFIEFRWFWAIKNFRTGALCRIFKYSTEHLKVPGNL